MRLSTKEAIKEVLTRDAIFEWLETEQNDVDWAVEHLIRDILNGDDETKEDFYQYVRNLFISTMVVGVPVERLPFAGLSTLRVTVQELEQHYPMDPDEFAYVESQLTDSEPAQPTFTYKAEGKKAVVVGLLAGIALGVGIVALIRAARK
ncbi:hypothetical protein pEaSNUABM37_00146 [Erwinia phage pEa_SNUABM_37]|nr:hypothetical protein pEaSNUABM37_00146 [Erwinia phage pEa_SNUABM_37]QXO10616.1 hypothetical protein pEaSNUABM48_00146 [Erwinia phage pEa_SNUABM_48]